MAEIVSKRLCGAFGAVRLCRHEEAADRRLDCVEAGHGGSITLRSSKHIGAELVSDQLLGRDQTDGFCSITGMWNGGQVNALDNGRPD